MQEVFVISGACYDENNGDVASYVAHVFDSLEKATKALNEIADNWVEDNYYEDMRDEVEITKEEMTVSIFVSDGSYYEEINIIPMKVE